MNIHHIGIIVKNLNRSIDIYTKLGYLMLDEIVVDKFQNNKIVFMKSMNKNQMIELIQPIDQTSTIYNCKEGYHHICYDVCDIPNFFDYFKSLKIGKLFTKKIKAPAIDNRYVIFGCLNNGVFLEFLL